MERQTIGSPPIEKTDSAKTEQKTVIALAGNPNVGKSTLFNLLTGLNQHTGNWPGKTVKSATGSCIHQDKEYFFVDLPGCYSLKSHSPEEEVARDYILSGIPDLTIVVCDATSLERNLNLALQILEITDNVIICVNLMDEAHKKHISVDPEKLARLLGVTVIGTSARSKESADIIFDAILAQPPKVPKTPLINYPDYIENAITSLSEGFDRSPKENRARAIEALEKNTLPINGRTPSEINDEIAYTISKTAESISSSVVKRGKIPDSTLTVDKLLTSKFFGFAAMFILFLAIFWLTITGSNYPSHLLSQFFTSLEAPFYKMLTAIKIPQVLCDMTVYGIYHILTWIISVMLPPMAIFFPLFTILEDVGFLPRVAFNLDKCFKKCSACGKQALTMCMGFGCNAVGVTGCRIIDSPRERLIAILTNSFVPCNGRFPALIALITVFFITGSSGIKASFVSALLLTVTVLLGVAATFLVSKLLSKTLLKGIPSSFTLELPPYRRPQYGKIIIRSIFDRTLFVLGRAVTVAAPAGLIIWLLANITIGEASLLSHISTVLDPFGRILGLDGVIITAFIIGFPANEIVFPLILMMYTANNVLIDTGDIWAAKNILTANGWNTITALNTIIFMLFHWPCSTTCLTIFSETKSVKWTFLSVILPTLTGFIICFLINLIF